MAMAWHPPGSWWVLPAWIGHKCSGGNPFLWQGKGPGNGTAPLQPARLHLVCSLYRDSCLSAISQQQSWLKCSQATHNRPTVQKQKATRPLRATASVNMLQCPLWNTYTSQWMYSASLSRRCSSEKDYFKTVCKCWHGGHHFCFIPAGKEPCDVGTGFHQWKLMVLLRRAWPGLVSRRVHKEPSSESKSTRGADAA